MEKPTLVPFVKWVGGKRQLLPTLLKKMPQTYNTYIEPFVGGGALFFALQPARAIINDLNKELMVAYKVIKGHHNLLVEHLTSMEMGHKPEMYYSIRKMDQKENLSMPFPPSKQLIAARFIYLNKAGFNGLYRVNKSGQFNVPNGKRTNLNTYDYDNIKRISDFLKLNDVHLWNQSFQQACLAARPGDFVYLDPPYDYEVGQNGFDAYLKTKFGITGQKLLAKTCQTLHAQGINFMVSNHNTKLVQELYKDFKIEVIKVKRLVGGKHASRAAVEEVVIRNYE